MQLHFNIIIIKPLLFFIFYFFFPVAEISGKIRFFFSIMKRTVSCSYSGLVNFFKIALLSFFHATNKKQLFNQKLQFLLFVKSRCFDKERSNTVDQD